LAITFISAVTVTVFGFSVPERLPLQPVNRYALLGVAVNVMDVPSKMDEPEGETEMVPPSEGDELVLIV
jgi:hypothetical protein